MNAYQSGGFYVQCIAYHDLRKFCKSQYHSISLCASHKLPELVINLHDNHPANQALVQQLDLKAIYNAAVQDPCAARQQTQDDHPSEAGLLMRKRSPGKDGLKVDPLALYAIQHL